MELSVKLKFLHLLATKPMAKQSRALGQVLGGHWVSTGQNFDFFLQIFKNP